MIIEAASVGSLFHFPQSQRAGIRLGGYPRPPLPLLVLGEGFHQRHNVALYGPIPDFAIGPQ
jgi:hypothetical protein